MESIKTTEQFDQIEKKSIQISGAEAVVRCLIEEGVGIIYGYPGGAIMPVYDELYKFQNQLHHVLARHEQGAVHAAQGFARVSGEVGVAIATSGPGATNLVTGIADAMIDSTPILCITGQVGSHLLGSDAFQETDVIGISTPITKWNYQITNADEIPETIAKAFYIARSGRPGPVLIDITKNAQFESLDYEYHKCTAVRSYEPKITIDQESIRSAVSLIDKAKQPLIVFGQGVILGKAEQELKNFVEKSGIPAVWTILGLSAMPTSHPLNMGMVGMHGNYAPNLLTNQCDLLIAIGMRFDDRVTGDLNTYAKQAKIIHLELDPSEVNKNVLVDVVVLGDCKLSLAEITKHIKPNQYLDWINEFKKLYEIEYKKVIVKEFYPKSDGLTMAETVEIINKHSQGDAVIVTDVGQHQMVACRYAKFNRSKSNITSGGLGTMGFALPAAMGAKMGAPDRHVVAIIGDGGFQMTLQELGTIFQTKIGVKIVILNNNFLGMVRQWQQLFFDKRYASTELINPDFVGIAKAYYIKSDKISKREDLDGAVAKMFEYDGPYLLEIVVQQEENVFPMVPSGACVSSVRLE